MRPKFGSEGGYMLLSPAGKRFKESKHVIPTYDKALELARTTALRIVGEGRRDPVYIVACVASVKAPSAPPPVEVTEIESA